MAKKISAAAKAELSEWARGFALLSDPTRLGILKLLGAGPRNVTALCNGLGLKQPTVSHHLGLLRMGRLVVGTRQGKSVVYNSDKKNLKALVSAIGTILPSK